MMNSPWATFTTFVTPQITFRPCAITANTQPSIRPTTRSAATSPRSAIVPPDLAWRALALRYVGIADGRLRDVGRLNDLQLPVLPLHEDHRMRGLEPSRIDLEPSEERHDLHLGESLSHGGRVQAVRDFDRLYQDE